jgi:hypothetical protein
MRGRPLPQMTPARPGDTVRPFVCSRGTWSKMGKWSVAIPIPIFVPSFSGNTSPVATSPDVPSGTKRRGSRAYTRLCRNARSRHGRIR